MIEWESPDKFIGTTAAIIMAIGAGVSAGTSIYEGKQNRDAAQKAGDLNATAADKQLQFAQQQSALDQSNFDKTQALNLDQYNQKEARLKPYRDVGTSANGTLSALLGLPQTGRGTDPTPAGKPSASVPNGDYQAWFQGLTAGKPFNQDTLRQLEASGELAKVGSKLTPGNKSTGAQSKIYIPGQGWVRVLGGAKQDEQVWVPQPDEAGGGTLAAFLPTQAPVVPAVPVSTPGPLTPLLAGRRLTPSASTLSSFLRPSLS